MATPPSDNSIAAALAAMIADQVDKSIITEYASGTGTTLAPPGVTIADVEKVMVDKMVMDSIIGLNSGGQIPINPLQKSSESLSGVLTDLKMKMDAKSDIPPLIPNKPQLLLHWFVAKFPNWKGKLTLASAKDKALWKHLTSTVTELVIDDPNCIPGKDSKEKTLLFVFDTLSNYDLLRTKGPTNEKGLPVFAKVPSIVQIRYHAHWLMGMYINSVNTGSTPFADTTTFEEHGVVPASVIPAENLKSGVYFGKRVAHAYVRHHLHLQGASASTSNADAIIATLKKRMKQKYS
jgi:hypothetical protein